MKTPLTHHRRTLLTLALLLAGAFTLITNRVLLNPAGAAPAPPPSATLTVSNSNDSGPGSLRDAISAAAPGDTIDFNLSGCPCTITLTSGQLIIDKDLAINGPGENVLTISGNNASRIFFINPGEAGAVSGPPATNPAVSINNLTIANGKAQGGKGGDFGALGGIHLTSGGGGGGGAGLGGALFCNNGIVTIDHVSFSGNQAIGGNGGRTLVTLPKQMTKCRRAIEMTLKNLRGYNL